MSKNKRDKPSQKNPFHTSRDELSQIERQTKALHAEIPHFKLAFTDQDFLLREELRSVRIQLELLRPELVLKESDVNDTVVFFGSARIPDPEYAEEILQQAKQALAQNEDSLELKQQYNIAKNIHKNSLYLQKATKLAEIVSNYPHTDFVVQTGGGQGYMRAANRGAHQAHSRSVSLGMLLPNDRNPNEFVSPELTFQFHYFAIRKMHFLMRAKALIVFPGGFGTFDELFETLTLIQTHKIDPIPVLLFRKEFWNSVVKFDNLVEQGTISPENLDIFHFVETAEEAWQFILDFYQLPA